MALYDRTLTHTQLSFDARDGTRYEVLSDGARPGEGTRFQVAVSKPNGDVAYHQAQLTSRPGDARVQVFEVNGLGRINASLGRGTLRTGRNTVNLIQTASPGNMSPKAPHSQLARPLPPPRSAAARRHGFHLVHDGPGMKGPKLDAKKDKKLATGPGRYDALRAAERGGQPKNGRLNNIVASMTAEDGTRYAILADGPSLPQGRGFQLAIKRPGEPVEFRAMAPAPSDGKAGVSFEVGGMGKLSLNANDPAKLEAKGVEHLLKANFRADAGVYHAFGMAPPQPSAALAASI